MQKLIKSRVRARMSSTKVYNLSGTDLACLVALHMPDIGKNIKLPRALEDFHVPSLYIQMLHTRTRVSFCYTGADRTS